MCCNEPEPGTEYKAIKRFIGSTYFYMKFPMVYTREQCILNNCLITKPSELYHQRSYTLLALLYIYIYIKVRLKSFATALFYSRYWYIM